MTTYAYLRVSTDEQDVSNQRHGLLEYANKHGLSNIQFVEDSVSGKISWKERRIGKLIETTKEADIILVSEISRLGRSTLQVLELMEAAASKKIAIHITKDNMVMDGSFQSEIYATILGLAASIERRFISLRTKEALEKRRADGLPLGRPKGSKAKSHKLDGQEKQIRMYLEKGINKTAIAKLVDCPRQTLMDWLKRDGQGKGRGKAVACSNGQMIN